MLQVHTAYVEMIHDEVVAQLRPGSEPVRVRATRYGSRASTPIRAAAFVSGCPKRRRVSGPSHRWRACALSLWQVPAIAGTVLSFDAETNLVVASSIFRLKDANGMPLPGVGASSVRCSCRSGKQPPKVTFSVDGHR